MLLELARWLSDDHIRAFGVFEYITLRAILASATALVLAAALVAEPGAAAVLVIKAVAIRPATERAGLMAIAQLRVAQPCQGSKDLRPAAPGFWPLAPRRWC